MLQNEKQRNHYLNLVLLIAALALAPSALAQTTWNVPDDFPTLQDAVVNAAPGDTIVLAEGEYCGAIVDRTLTITGAKNAKVRIVSCPGNEPFFNIGGKLFYIGLFMEPPSSGSTISHLTFDGSGWTTDNDQLAVGISAPFFFSTGTSVDDLTIEHNRFLGGVAGLSVRGSGNSINQNVFDGYTIDDFTGYGGWGVDLISLDYWWNGTAASGNSVENNTFSTAVRENVEVPWLFGFPDVTFVGVVATAQNDLLVRANKFSISPDTTGSLFGAGVILSDELWWGPSEDAVIIKNDGRRSEYMLIITTDVFGGTGNSIGAVLRGNFGVNNINNVQTDVDNRSIKTVLECDGSGVCP